MSFCQARKESIQSSKVVIFFTAIGTAYHIGICPAILARRGFSRTPDATSHRLGRSHRRLRAPLATDHAFLGQRDGRRRTGARPRRRPAPRVRGKPALPGPAARPGRAHAGRPRAVRVLLRGRTVPGSARSGAPIAGLPDGLSPRASALSERGGSLLPV